MPRTPGRVQILMPVARGLRIDAAVRAADTHPAETPLSEYIREKGLTIYAVAKAAGFDPKTVKGWAVGRCLPPLVAAFRLEAATEGAVPVASWLGTELGKSQWEHGGLNWERWQKALAKKDILRRVSAGKRYPNKRKQVAEMLRGAEK